LWLLFVVSAICALSIADQMQESSHRAVPMRALRNTHEAIAFSMNKSTHSL
jgi:hypothetical protein